MPASEERFAGIFQQTGVGVIQCELDGLFLVVYRQLCEITGRTADELLTLRVPDVTHPDDRETDTALLQRLVADGVPFTVEKRYLRLDGSEVWVSVNVSLQFALPLNYSPSARAAPSRSRGQSKAKGKPRQQVYPAISLAIPEQRGSVPATFSTETLVFFLVSDLRCNYLGN